MTHDRCEEIQNLPCFVVVKSVLWWITLFLHNLFWLDLRAFAWRKLSQKLGRWRKNDKYEVWFAILSRIIVFSRPPALVLDPSQSTQFCACACGAKYVHNKRSDLWLTLRSAPVELHTSIALWGDAIRNFHLQKKMWPCLTTLNPIFQLPCCKVWAWSVPTWFMEELMNAGNKWSFLFNWVVLAAASHNLNIKPASWRRKARPSLRLIRTSCWAPTQLGWWSSDRVFPPQDLFGAILGFKFIIQNQYSPPLHDPM